MPTHAFAVRPYRLVHGMPAYADLIKLPVASSGFNHTKSIVRVEYLFDRLHTANML